MAQSLVLLPDSGERSIEIQSDVEFGMQIVPAGKIGIRWEIDHSNHKPYPKKYQNR
jgi:hypothetical protein